MRIIIELDGNEGGPRIVVEDGRGGTTSRSADSPPADLARVAERLGGGISAGRARIAPEHLEAISAEAVAEAVKMDAGAAPAKTTASAPRRPRAGHR
jgi:hypothetical protein